MTERTVARSIREWTVRILPYVFAAGALFLILRKYSLTEIAREVGRGDTLAAVPFAVLGFVLTLLIVSAADAMVFRDNLGGPRYSDVVRGKAASVVLFLVHYGLGQGAYGAWVARKTGSRAGPASGALLYIVAAELCTVCGFAALVILATRPDVPSALLTTTASISLVLAALVALGPVNLFDADRVVVFRPWTRMRRSRGLVQLGVRVVQHGVGTLAAALAARAFGLDIPLAVLMAYLPIVGVVGALPVNVAGFGAVQAVWLLLSPWAPGEQILAFAFVWQFLVSGVLVLRGLPFVSGVIREIREGVPEPRVIAARPQASS